MTRFRLLAAVAALSIAVAGAWLRAQGSERAQLTGADVELFLSAHTDDARLGAAGNMSWGFEWNRTFTR